MTGVIEDHMASLVTAQLLFLEADNPKKEISMYINNPGAATVSVEIFWLERGRANPDPVSRDFEIQPGATMILQDVIRNDFGMNRGAGAFRITTDGGDVIANLAFVDQCLEAVPLWDFAGEYHILPVFMSLEEEPSKEMQEEYRGHFQLSFVDGEYASDLASDILETLEDAYVEVGSDLDMSNVLVQNRVSEAQASVPEEVKRLGITVKKQLSFPLMLVSIYSPNQSYDQNFLSNYLTINVLDAVARIRGVGQAQVLGGSEYAMRVWVKPDQLAKLNLTVPDITRAIQEQNVIAPAGQIGGPPAAAGTEFTYTVQTPGRLETAEEFGNVVVRSNPDGSQVRLKDVARLELGTQFYNMIGRLNGKPRESGFDIAPVGGEPPKREPVETVEQALGRRIERPIGDQGVVAIESRCHAFPVRDLLAHEVVHDCLELFR